MKTTPMNSQLLRSLTALALLCTLDIPPETMAAPASQPAPGTTKASQAPAAITFVGGYTDPLASKKIDELKALAEQQIKDVGGWAGVQEALAEPLWVQGENWVGCACPACQPGGAGKDPRKLVLKDGGLVCKSCGAKVYPSPQFPVNHEVELVVRGRSYRTKGHRSEKGLNFLLQDHFRQMRQRQLQGREGLLAVHWMLYARTHEDQYAERCIELLLGMARNPEGLVLLGLTFGGKQDRIANFQGAWQKIGGYGFHAKPEVDRYWVLAYGDLLQRDDLWKRFGDPAALKAKVRDALVARHEYYVSLMLHGLGGVYSYMGNIFDQTLRSMALTALYCDYPKALVDCAHFLDAQSRLLSTFEGVEAESGSYQAQSVGCFGRSLGTASRVLDCLLENGGIAKDSAVHDYIARSFDKARRVHMGNIVYPNGDWVRVGDTSGKPSLDKTAFAPSKASPDPGWGYFPLCSTNRTYLGLILPPRGYSHHHGDDLSIVLWGSGRELLPDYGYTKAFYRYFATDMVAHNGAKAVWRGNVVLDVRAKAMQQASEAWRASHPAPPKPDTTAISERPMPLADLINSRAPQFAHYGDAEPETVFKEWRRTAVYQYVPEGLLPFVDAASPGPIANGIQARGRILMLIPVHATSALAVDVHRIAGGDMHQVGFQAPFSEDIASDCSAPSVKDRAAADKEAAFWAGRFIPAFKTSFRCDDIRDATQPWAVTWTAKPGGARLRTYGISSADAVLLNGESPDVTRDPHSADWVRPKDAPLPPWRPHAYWRRTAAAAAPAGSLRSLFALVYEHGRNGEPAPDGLLRLGTIALPDADASTPEDRRPLLLRLAFRSGRTDYVYTSCDDRTRNADGITFQGRAAWVSFGPGDGGKATAWAAAAWQGASARGKGIEFASAPVQVLDVSAASYRLSGKEETGTFEVRGSITNPGRYVGHWCRVSFGNDVNYIYRIREIRPSATAGEWRITFDGRPGMEKDASGWRHAGYPFKQGGESAQLHLIDQSELLTPAFQRSVKR